MGRTVVSENVASSVVEARLRKASTFSGSLNHMAIESNGKIPEGLQALPAPRMSQPQAMKTERYVYGVEEMNGFDAWALFGSLRSRRCSEGEGASDEGSAAGECAVLVPVSHSHGRARGACRARRAVAEAGCRPGPVALHVQLLGQAAALRQGARISPDRVDPRAGHAPAVPLPARLRRAERGDHRTESAQGGGGLAAASRAGVGERRLGQ